MSERNWRDAKIPQWAKDQIETELVAGALSWPTEAEPTPLPFYWAEYDHIRGDPVAGSYWVIGMFNHVHAVHIRTKLEGEKGWQQWRFSRDGKIWDTSVIRGFLYPTKRDATLAYLWKECRNSAKTLHAIRSKLDGESA